jgi:hypothetical protein
MNLPMTSDWFAKVLHWLQTMPSGQSEAAAASIARFSSDVETIVSFGYQLLAGLKQEPDALVPLQGPPAPETKLLRDRFNFLCRNYGAALQRSSLDAADTSESSIVDEIALLASNLYRALYPYSISDGEGLLLQALAWPRTDDALSELVSLLIEFPPHAWTSTAMGLSPLMRSTEWSVDAVFPQLLVGIHHPATIASVLDLANFCVHSRMVDEHPANGLTGVIESNQIDSEATTSIRLEDSLTQMLGGVVARLGIMEENPTKFGSTPEEIQRVLGDAIAICVSLSDALGLLKYEPAIGKLNQALQLSHRRVQAEAAAALARMNQEDGRDKLIALAAEPITRLRVLKYAEELNLSDKIDQQYATPQAIAESELALWLAQPQQLGIPPHSIELIDNRTLFWPSFESPQECWLFRFQYQMAHGTWSNIAMAGPLLHAFGADLAELPIADIYAAFAGWQAEHSEIYEVPVQAWNTSQQRVADQLERALENQGHSEIRRLWLGFFLTEICLVAESDVDGISGVAVTDGLETMWYPSVGRQRPLGPLEAYSIFKGRKMLRSFNPDLLSDLEDIDDS